MQALVLEDAYTFAPREMPKPVAGPGEALIRVLSAGVCGSELHAYHGKHPKRKPPAIMGHEVCGVVEALGPPAEPATAEAQAAPAGRSPVAPGDRVVVLPQKACGHCVWCLAHKPNLCDHKVMLGERTWPGGYAEYFTAPVNLLYPVPAHLGDDAATLIEPLAVAVHAVRSAGVVLGDSVTVLGAGAIGLMTMAAAKAAGAALVLGSDVCATNLDRAREAGATHICDARTEDVVAMATGLTAGLGTDHTFMAVDAPGLFTQAVNATRKQGRLTLIALFTDPATFNLQHPKAKELTMRGSLTFDPGDFAMAAELAGRLPMNLDAFITHRFPLTKGHEAFALAHARTEDMVRVVLHP